MRIDNLILEIVDQKLGKKNFQKSFGAQMTKNQKQSETPQTEIITP